MFPHEIIDYSFFDEQTNSVFFLCKDPTINPFNPYILLMCWHNHDIKCILSGKAAKAAMFYITDYITKVDLKTHLFCLKLWLLLLILLPIQKLNKQRCYFMYVFHNFHLNNKFIHNKLQDI